ncbi:MAG: hypothetical protein Q8P32_04790 [Candidatus Komeilibacteria bacterium]|nr:hypothetical protein [Candidatus Komeilibacteria bacterium]
MQNRDGPKQKAEPIPEFERILESSDHIICVQMTSVYVGYGYAIIEYPIGQTKVSIKFQFETRRGQPSAWRGDHDLKVKEQLLIKVGFGDKGYYAKEAWPKAKPA